MCFNMIKLDIEKFAFFSYVFVGLLVGVYSYNTWLQQDFLLSLGATVFWPLALIIYAIKTGFSNLWS